MKKNFRIMQLVIIIAILGASMVGISIWGISINKLSLIPLFLYLCLFREKGYKIRIDIRMRALLLMLFLITISCLRASVEHGMNSYINMEGRNFYYVMLTQIIQNIIVYIPLIILLENKSSNFKTSIYICFKKAIIVTCIIQGGFFITQFICWHVFNFDITKYIFEEMLNNVIEGISYGYTHHNGVGIVRMMGLGHDAALLSLVMVLGICFDKNRLRKFFYFLICVLSTSRTGVVASLGVILYQKVSLKTFKLSLKKIFISTGFVLFLVLLVFFLYEISDVFALYVNRMMVRFDLSDNNISNSQHIGYIVYLIPVWITELNLTEKILGIGYRASGLAVIRNNKYRKILNTQGTLKRSVRSVECDPASFLWGTGILGFMSYYWVCWIYYKYSCRDVKSVVVGVVCMGIMYSIGETTLWILVFIMSAMSEYVEDDVLTSS